MNTACMMIYANLLHFLPDLSSRVRDQLKYVGQICGADCAFVAILADVTVVTWGEPKRGGDRSDQVFGHLDETQNTPVLETNTFLYKQLRFLS